jgi:tetratricopeptide (TPR) repeat protein
MDIPGLATITQLTQLLATYGIYALVIIFMFYQQRRARLALKECTAADRPYYQKQNTTVLWTTIALSILAVAIWIYTMFVYKPKLIIEGTIRDLPEQPKRPVQIGDPPMVIHRIAAFRGDVNFYSSEKPSIESDSVDLGWVIVSPGGPQLLQLVFQKQYYMLSPKSLSEALTINPGQDALKSRVIEGYPRKMASLNLDGHKSLLGQQIQIVYKPDPMDPIRNIGMLYVADGEHFFPIPWVEDSALDRARINKQRTESSFGSDVAWAQTSSDHLIGENGEIQPEVARRVRQYLESDDLTKQLFAQSTLVENGPRSFSLIRQILPDKSGEARNRGLLVHNLVNVVERIERNGTHAPSDLNEILGDALYSTGDSSLAALYFGRVPESQQLPAIIILHRSLVMLEAKHFDEAEQGFKKYLETASTPGEKSMALSNLGATLSRKGDPKQAREYFKESISLNPNNITAQINLGRTERSLGNLPAAASAFERAAQLNPKDATAKIDIATVLQAQGDLESSARILEEVIQNNQDPRALNNLAYVYALRGEKLDKALSYADQAIKLGDESPQALDTKGWVLYKMGNLAQGLDFLRQAQAKAPADPVIRGHFEEAQKMIATKK